MALGRLDIIMAADMAQLRKDMNTAVGIMQSGAKQMESVAKTAATTMAGYFTFDYFKENIKQTLEYADSLSKLSQKSGITAEALYSLNAAAKLSDVSFESLQKSLVKFNKNIGEASKGSGDALIAFKSFGMNIKNQDGTLKNSFELIGDLADQFENMPDGVSKTTLAMQLFGKSGADMIPLLNSGKESLREYLGVIDQDTAKAAERFNDSLTKISLSIKNGLMGIAKEAIPTLNDLSETFESVSSKGGLLERNAKEIGDAINSSYTFIKNNRDGILSLGEAYLVYKASVWSTTIAQNTFNAMQEYSAKVTAQNTALVTASAEAERLGTIAIQTRTLADVAKREAQLSGLAVLERHAVMLEKEAVSAEKAAKSATVHSYELQGLASKTSIVTSAISGLVTTFKALAPTAALFAITEIFLNWDKITGNIKTNLVSASDQLEKMTNNQLNAQLDAYKNKITEINEEIQKLSPKSKGFSYFGTLSEEDKTKAKAQIDTLKQQKEQIEKTVKEINFLKNNPKKEEPNTKKDKSSDAGLTDYQIQITQISNQIQALAKQYDIKKQIKDLDIETQLRNMQISQPYSDYLKTENEILTSISKNEETISLLRQKADKETSEGGRIEDLQKINDLQKENELQQLKITANKEKYNQLISIGNSQLRDSIAALDMSDIDKKYQDLAKEVANLVKEGRSLELVGEYATKVADQLKREDAYNHLQKELEIRKDTIELTMYGSEKETALESLRHEEVLANLQRELETRKVNYDEYLKLMNLEMTRHAQNADELRKFMLSAFDNIEKALDSSFFDAMQDKFKTFGDWLKSFSKNLGNSIAQGLSRTLAGGIVNSLRSSLFSNMGTGLTLGSLAVGSAVSASEISTIMNSGGTFDSATNTITTSGGSKIGVGSDGGGTVKSTGSDVMNLVNIVSTLKTAYSVATTGLSATIASGVSSISSGLSSMGMAGAANTFSSFGYGVASPSMAGLTGTYGAAASIGSAVGYVTPYVAAYFAARWGSKQFEKMMGISTYDLDWKGYIKDWSKHSTWENVNFVLTGGLNMPFVGKKKTTDTGLQFLQDVTSASTLDNTQVRAYMDWKSKTLFSSKSGTELSDIDEKQLRQIETVFDYYQDLLKQLGETETISLAAGKYSGESFQEAITRSFITAFTDVNQATDDAIYKAWVDYAKEIDKTVTEALTSSISAFVTEKRTFEIWQVGASSVEGLAKKAQFAKEDLDNLANSLGATGVTVENYLQRYNEAVKNSFDAQTITSWKNLGDSLMSATDAQKAYTEALSKTTTAEDTYRKQILENQAANAKNIDAVFKNLSLQGLTVAQTFKELTNKEAPKTIKEWEAVGEELKKTEQVLSNEILTAFQNIGAELKQAVTNTKLLASSLLNTGDALGALKTLMSLEEFKTADFGGSENFNAGVFNYAYAKKELEIASRLANQTSENALSMQNAMQTFNTLSGKIKGTALSEYGVLFAENYKNFAYGFAEAVTGSKELTASFNNLVGISNELAKSYAYEQGMMYIPSGSGVAALQSAMMQASLTSVSSYSSRLGKTIYGMEEIALDKTFATLAGELKRGTINADEYSKALEFINNGFADTIDLMGDTEAQLKRIADAQYNIWSTAVTSTEFYFTKINEQADAYVATLKETTEGYKGATEAIGRLNSLTEVLAFTSSNINLEGMRNYLGGNADLTQEAYVKSTATLISSAAKFLSAEITTADAKQAAEAIKQKASFSGVDALKIRDLSLAFENLKAYDATSLEGTLSLLNKELINKSITDAQYVDLFNIGLDVYRDTQDTQKELLKDIKGYLADIADYQRELLGGDLSPLSSIDKYNYTAQQTSQIAKQALDAVANGDLENFSTYFNSYKQVSTDFLTISKELSANNETYMNDFSKVYNALESMKSFSQTPQDYLKIDGSHANGLDFVPFNGYVAELHYGERVQTASQARQQDILSQEVRQLREDLRSANSALASHMAKTARILDKWDSSGMPEVAV